MLDFSETFVAGQWQTWEYLNEQHLIPYGIPKEDYYKFLHNQAFGEHIEKARERFNEYIRATD